MNDYKNSILNIFLNQTPNAIEALGIEQLTAWGKPALETLISDRRAWRVAQAYLRASLELQGTIPLHRWQFFLVQAIRIFKTSPSASAAFVRNGSQICRSMNDRQTIQWVEKGLSGNRSTQSIVQYFNGISAEALANKDEIESHVALKDRIHILSLVCEANLGKPVQIQSNASLAQVRGFKNRAATDGKTIYLPDISPSFGLFKLMALHQSMLLESTEWIKGYEENRLDADRVHVEADRRLLQRLPGLKSEMIRLMNGRISLAYPLDVNEDIPPLPLPWWGDLLPNLIHETNSMLQAVQEKAADYTDCPPAMVEGIIAGLMAKGQRSIDGLWEMLRLTFNTTDFRTFDQDDLPEHTEQFFYDEWDKCLSSYKKDWCVVHQQPAGVDPNPFVDDVRIRLQGLVSLVRRQFMRFKPEKFKKYRAQSSGDELDIDALIQAVADKRAGSFLDENVYLRRDKMERDVSVLFLVDISDSTDEKVNVFTIKDFDEPNNDFVKYRLGNLEPGGLTRMGAAVRHAASRLSDLPSKVKLLVILTDGRPFDIDYGDLDYAIADTKKAIHEARRKKIDPFIITSDKEGANYLRKISPITQSIVLPRIELLPAMLPAIYKRLTI